MKVMKPLIVLMGLLLLIALSGCVGPDGKVYLSFDWVYTPDNWYGTDQNIDIPYVVDTLYPNRDYETQPGTYYFEYYHSVSGFTRWIWYDLTAKEGVLLIIPGDDSRFELFLNAYLDPDFTQLQSLIAAEKSKGEAEALLPAGSSSQSGSSLIDESSFTRKQLYEYTETKGRWTLHVKGGVWEPKP